MNRTCDFKPTVREEIDDKADYIIENLLKYDPSKLGTEDMKLQELIDLLYNEVVVSDKMNFVKCWFKGHELDCSRIGSKIIIIDVSTPLSAFSVNINPSVFDSFWNSTGTVLEN